MSHTPVLRRSAGRAVPVVLLVVAASLAVASALHLSGHVTGRGAPYDPDGAGIAEAVLGAVLVAGAAGMLAAPRRARTTGLVATGIVTAGFLVGLRMTALGGHWPDIAYHLTTLPVLIGTLVVLVRPAASRGAPRAGG